MKIYNAKNDIVLESEGTAFLKDDVVALLEENDKTVTINLKKDGGFDINDSEYTVEMDSKIFNENFELVEELDKAENKTESTEDIKTEEEKEECSVKDEEQVEQDWVDPELEKNKKKMITQEIDELERKLAKDLEEQKMPASVKEKYKKEKELLSLEESELKFVIRREAKKMYELIEEKNINAVTKTKLKTIIENFLQKQANNLSETFDDRLKFKIYELEEAKQKEIDNFIKNEKKEINDYVDYVSREMIIEMKNSFVDEAIVEESLKYRKDLETLKEKFSKLSDTYKKLKESHDKKAKEIGTLKEESKKLHGKVSMLIKHGLVRDVLDTIKDDSLKENVQAYSKTIQNETNENFFNKLSEHANKLLKENKIQKITKNDDIIVESKLTTNDDGEVIERENVLSTDTSSEIYEKKKEINVVDLYTSMLT
jgi:hypothetical protein